MRKVLTLLMLFCCYTLAAQSYNNEWIKFNQVYYKFKVGKTGIFRIPKSTLDAAGIGNTAVEYFELWRNGQRVPFYPTVLNGVLPANGYLEFWGQQNDGVADKPLYRNEAFQHTNKSSLITDTASYFLSVNTDQSGFRYVSLPNNVVGNSLPPENYFMHTEARYYKDKVNFGHAGVVGEYIYSSSYDKGEFTSSGDISPAAPLLYNLTQLRANASGPDATFRFGAFGNVLNTRSVKVKINGVDVIDSEMGYFNDVHTSLTIPISQLTSATVPVQFYNTSLVGTDRMVVSYFELAYARYFNFNNSTNFEFTLPAKTEGYYLQITNFNTGSVAPVLFDMANGERFVGNIAVADTVRFALPGMDRPRNLVLVNSSASNATAITTMTSRIFTNYNLTSNHGNYIIISHPWLHAGTSGNDPVLDYKDYRQSVAGGGYTVLVTDIEELIDQFAFGIKKHPVSIRNFLRFARTRFSMPPQFAFLIGKGMTYVDYRKNQASAEVEKLNLVPTFGYPGSDNMLAGDDITNPIAVTPVGRLSAIRGKEIEDYLEKIKEYEHAQKTAPNTIADRAWMKNVVHVAGSSDLHQGNLLCTYLDVCRRIIEDTAFGGFVTRFCKSSTNPVEQISSGRLESLFAEGISFLTYFGHSSSTILDFNIDNPQNYYNPGKYPVFFVNGCNAGNFFTYNLQRLVATETLSEKFTLAPQRGSIAFVASTHYGIVLYLEKFLVQLYNSISITDYGKPLGVIQRNTLEKLISAAGGPFDFFTRIHAEQITLHGDPAIKINGQPKPDYVVEEPSIKVSPTLVSIADVSFSVKTRIVNIGKAVSDSLMVIIKHQLPDGTIETLFRKKIRYVHFADSITLNVNIDPLRHKGLNRILVTADPDDVIDESDESNNTSQREFHIYEDEARPVYPYNLSIIKNPTQKLYASTANPLAPAMEYRMEIDTTQSFNSPRKIPKTVRSNGGVIEFDPGITYDDSVVYYWRVAPAPRAGAPVWVNASFTYIPDQEGFNQSHHDQHKQSTTERLSYDTTNHDWRFGRRTNNLFVINTVYRPGEVNDNDLTVSVNGNNYIRSACKGSSLVFNVFDSVTFKPWRNVDASGTSSLNLYGSEIAHCQPTRNYNFEFQYLNAESRKKIMDFMDILPNGVFVVVRSFDAIVPSSFSATWRADTSIYGSNNSLYHKLLAAGFAEIDSLNSRRSWIMVYKKGDHLFEPKYDFTTSIYGRATVNVDCTTPDTLGYITSPKFGPAKMWKTVQWAGASLEDPPHDNPSVDVIGIDAYGTESILYKLDRFTREADITGIDATLYPYVRLRMRNADSLTLTPYQLKYWRILYDPVPEGAMAANLYYISRDSVEVGEDLNLGVAFKNISAHTFDSIRVKVNVIDKNNIVHELLTPKLKPIATGEADSLKLTINTTHLPGDNTLFIDVNPDNDQPEQYHFNNFLYKNFYARLDKVNPLLDVTFDGVHILNRDIVSAKPHIQIKLKDEAKYLLLNDTALSLVQIKYPDGNIRTFNFDGDTLRFTPATSGEDNTATIDFNPAFLGATDNDGDEFELIVRGKDRSNNRSGDAEYRISFRVISKPMISNLLNYPNPFSTSTAFVFTVTGTEIPQNIKIQILTVTGKIVREITREELGPLHIGRNITGFKWDGTDQYGQKLGNGVYLYRVVTTMNGKPMEKYRAQGDNTDKYFTNGYGKMYLMR